MHGRYRCGVRRSLVICWFLAACGDDGTSERELQQGGTNTVADRSTTAYTHPLPGLDRAQAERHRGGSGPFAFEWQPPQLGPLFNHSACIHCHTGNGRGMSQIGPSVFGSEALVRISMPVGTPDVPGGPVPVPGLGLQLQDHGDSVLPEGNVALSWIETEVTFGDGTVQPMREPRILVTRPDGSSLPAGTQLSYRQAQVVFGLGLLEAVPEATIRALADPDDADGDGISGRPNEVWDARAGAMTLGRFGHKASVASLVEQTGGAFANDIGLTNRVVPERDGMTELSDQQLDDTAFFVATIAVPAAAPRSSVAQRGRALFDDLGCASCHTPTLVTGPHTIAQLADQTIHPYTDLLLHDVGDRLTDTRADFAATGLEWRTPPLWGLGLAQTVAPDATFLHDGRARSLAEAILWHGGEAQAASDAFRTADAQDRAALLAFLATL